MPDKLILESKPVLVNYSEIVNNYSIVEGSASGKPVCLEDLNIFQEAKGPGFADLSHKVAP